jgi:hypothetical protein
MPIAERKCCDDLRAGATGSIRQRVASLWSFALWQERVEVLGTIEHEQKKAYETGVLTESQQIPRMSLVSGESSRSRHTTWYSSFGAARSVGVLAAYSSKGLH